MPIHDSGRQEFAIDSGYINIVTDEGQTVPAYWAHPRFGRKFSGICLLHDWWGMTNVPRLLSNFFAQVGYYVIAPDLFNGVTCTKPAEAMKHLKKTEETRYKAVNASLSVLEEHHQTNRTVAAIGVGMGGTLALEAAIKRHDLEAAISYGGFPQQYLGQFARGVTPILALYGSNDPFIKHAVIETFRAELQQTNLADKHQIIIVDGAGHEFFKETAADNPHQISKFVINHTLKFLELHLDIGEHQRRSRI